MSLNPAIPLPNPSKPATIASTSTASPQPLPPQPSPIAPTSTWAEKVRAPPPRAQGSRNPNHSWPDKLRVTNSKTRFCLEPIEGIDLRITEDGVLKIPDNIVVEAKPFWEKCLVGWFYGTSMPFFAVKSVAMKEWKQFGLEDVLQKGKSLFVFRFLTLDGLHTVLDRGPWLFGSRTISLSQWDASLDADDDSKVPVWVRLHGLPLSVWHPRGLSYVSAMIGRPLACDQMTSERRRISYARVLIELDAARLPPREIELATSFMSDSVCVRVEYEWKPSRCPHCCEWGHVCSDSDSDGSTDSGPEGVDLAGQGPATVGSEAVVLGGASAQVPVTTGSETGVLGALPSEAGGVDSQVAAGETSPSVSLETPSSVRSETRPGASTGTVGAPVQSLAAIGIGRSEAPSGVVVGAPVRSPVVTRGLTARPTTSVVVVQQPVETVTHSRVVGAPVQSTPPCALNREQPRVSTGSRFSPLYTDEVFIPPSDGSSSSSSLTPPPPPPVKGKRRKKKK